jgi:hypothetical protein
MFRTERNFKLHLSVSRACTQALCALNATNRASNNTQQAQERNDDGNVLPDNLSACVDANAALDDANEPWDCLRPWDSDSSSEEDSSDASTNDSISANNDENTVVEDAKPGPNSGTTDGVCFTRSDYVETKLLKLLDDAHAPHFLYKDVLNWAREANKMKYEFRPARTTRRAQINYIEKLAQLQHCRPETIQLKLPGDGVVVPVTRFPFVNMLFSLLTDTNLVSDLSNLDVNPDNLFGKYQSEGDYLTVPNSGAWYQSAYDDVIKDPEKDFLLPICFACDETKLTKTGKTGCWPLMFSTTLFNQKLRNNVSSWRPIGYIYDVNTIDSKEERGHQTNEYKGKRLHAIFQTVLETFIKAQNSGVLDNVPVTLGGITEIRNLRIPVIFIIGDMQGGDKMCCSSAGYSNKMNRLCRKCNVRGDQAGDPFVLCKRMNMLKIMELVERNNVPALKAINQYNVHSAWFDVGYGGCRFGIFSAAAPVEALHAIENGLMPDAIQVLFTEEMTPAQLVRLDGLAKSLASLPRQKFLSSGAEPLMPRLRWSDGITSLTDMPAKYKVGIMMTLVVITLTDDGVKFFTEVLGSKKRVAQMRQVFQMILSYWMWLKKATYWKRGDREAKRVARTAIRTMLHELMKLWPRQKGQGWEKAKLHEQLHVPDDIERNGAPIAWHSGCTENNHIQSVKNYARQTNRRRETLDAQIGARNGESFIINAALQKMSLAYADSDTDDEASFWDGYSGVAETSSKALVYIYKGARSISVGMPLWQSRKDYGPFHPWVVLFLKQYYESQPSTNVFDDNGLPVHGCASIATEYLRGGQIFRAHPKYRNGMPWYDWAMFRWAKEGTRSKNKSKEDSCVHYGDDEDITDQYTYVPGAILGFMEVPVPSFPQQSVTKAIVVCCDSEYRKSSVFSTYWKVLYSDKAMTIPMIRLVDPNAIVRHTLMIPENDDWNGFHEIWARERWANEFCTV